MSDVHDPLPDWRAAESYRPLLAAESAVWAWEFGRRGAAITDDADHAIPDLCFVGGGPAGDPSPTVIWRWRCDPSVPVLSVAPASPKDTQALDLRAVDLPLIVVRTDDGEQHVWVGDGHRRLRFAVVEGDMLSGPVRCQVRLPDISGGAASLESLRLLIGLRDTGRLGPTRLRAAAKAARWLQVLRAHDARRMGASQRDIAMLLFGPARVREDWNGGSDYMRMRVQRLVKAADDLIGGGYRSLFGFLAPDRQAPRTLEVWRSAAWTRAAP